MISRSSYLNILVHQKFPHYGQKALDHNFVALFSILEDKREEMLRVKIKKNTQKMGEKLTLRKKWAKPATFSMAVERTTGSTSSTRLLKTGMA